jgi:hypothetical protein
MGCSHLNEFINTDMQKKRKKAKQAEELLRAIDTERRRK